MKVKSVDNGFVPNSFKTKKQPAFKATMRANAEAFEILAGYGDDFLKYIRQEEFIKCITAIKHKGQSIEFNLRSCSPTNSLKNKFLEILVDSPLGKNKEVFSPDIKSQTGTEIGKNFKNMLVNMVDHIELPRSEAAKKVVNVFDAINSGLY